MFKKLHVMFVVLTIISHNIVPLCLHLKNVCMTKLVPLILLISQIHIHRLIILVGEIIQILVGGIIIIHNLHKHHLHKIFKMFSLMHHMCSPPWKNLEDTMHSFIRKQNAINNQNAQIFSDLKDILVKIAFVLIIQEKVWLWLGWKFSFFLNYECRSNFSKSIFQIRKSLCILIVNNIVLSDEWMHCVFQIFPGWWNIWCIRLNILKIL